MTEWFDLMLAFAVGLALRFAVPMALTGVLVWWLRRLDLQWKAEAEVVHRVEIEHALAMQLPCWEQKHCPADRCAACPAYGRHDKACWQIMREANDGHLPARCLSCDVFQNAPAPVAA